MKTKIDDAYKHLACAVLNTIIDDAKKPKMYEDVIISLRSKRLNSFLSIAEISKKEFMTAVIPILKETKKKMIADTE